MSRIQLVPAILRMYVQNQNYSGELENLQFLDDNAYSIVSMILNIPRLHELLNDLTDNTDEQVEMLLALYRSPNNLNLLRENIVENVLDFFRTTLLNRRGTLMADPGSPVRLNDGQGTEVIFQPPGAPARPRRTRPVGEEARNVRARRNQEDEEYFDRLPVTIRYPVNPLIPDNFVEGSINRLHLNGNDECQICYSELNQEPVCMVYSEYTRDHCGHVFHCRCLTGWRNSLARNRNSCPYCRATISQVINNVELPSSSGGSRFGKNKLAQVESDIKYLKSI